MTKHKKSQNNSRKNPITKESVHIQFLADPMEGKDIYLLGCVTFFQTSRYQAILKATVFGVLAETANRSESGQLQFWSDPFEILNLRSSNTPETVAFNIP